MPHPSRWNQGEFGLLDGSTGGSRSGSCGMGALTRTVATLAIAGVGYLTGRNAASQVPIARCAEGERWNAGLRNGQPGRMLSPEQFGV
jgi:hypothetical protein